MSQNAYIRFDPVTLLVTGSEIPHRAKDTFKGMNVITACMNLAVSFKSEPDLFTMNEGGLIVLLPKSEPKITDIARMHEQQASAGHKVTRRKLVLDFPDEDVLEHDAGSTG